MQAAGSKPQAAGQQAAGQQAAGQQAAGERREASWADAWCCLSRARSISSVRRHLEQSSFLALLFTQPLLKLEYLACLKQCKTDE